MEPKSTIAFLLAPNSRVFPGSSSDDPDLMEGSGSSSESSPGQSKRKRSQVSHDVISTDGDDDPDGILSLGDNIPNQKNKEPVVYSENWLNQTKDVLSAGLIGSSTYNAKEDGTLLDIPGSSDPDLTNFNHSDGYEDDEFDFVEDDNVEFADDSYLMDNNDLNHSLAAKLDDLDLPPGVEASVAWLQKHNVRSTRSKKEKVDNEIELKFKSFKQFDTVQDQSDHYFANAKSEVGSSSVKKPPKDWVKKIQAEWKVLEKDLPENIFVRVYEDRMDILRAVIVGPAGTPYHDGLFFFDISFPLNYPHSPPLVHYHSGGLRINPNLYACGKVCLSLLNTWPGKGCEKWNSSSSTILQVLVSIQALVLNAKPYFNEPGYEQYANTPQGERLSDEYNEETFLHSCRTMLYTMRRPPHHFEVFVSGHFREKGTCYTHCVQGLHAWRQGWES
ncbi:hypothetical protein J5N97_004458 [Dioscorea zingiberensis]|uniref:E2 ubiquitin-conjugating enzyme n=1 Tax=Dioscorea zingiberensis TaxID=325984 RepID=A0A9D5HS56_9LILI|nr:hypothetical protein J5N97_004458 [Dioscorea zingiberensis]